MRVIAGSRKGHTLVAPRGNDTRPTSDRVRENVFNLLARDAGTLEQRADRMGAERVRTNAGRPASLSRCKRGPDVAGYES